MKTELEQLRVENEKLRLENSRQQKILEEVSGTNALCMNEILTSFNLIQCAVILLEDELDKLDPKKNQEILELAQRGSDRLKDQLYELNDYHRYGYLRSSLEHPESLENLINKIQSWSAECSQNPQIILKPDDSQDKVVDWSHARIVLTAISRTARYLRRESEDYELDIVSIESNPMLLLVELNWVFNGKIDARTWDVAIYKANWMVEKIVEMQGGTFEFQIKANTAITRIAFDTLNDSNET